MQAQGGCLVNSYNRVYIHFVWATWDREPTISPDAGAILYCGIAAACRKLKGMPLEIGGTEDHVHALVRIPGTVCTADMAHQMKGSSSHLENATAGLPVRFRWQGAYAAFSVSRGDVPRVRAYICCQKQHHSAGTIDPDLERCTQPADNETDDEETFY